METALPKDAQPTIDEEAAARMHWMSEKPLPELLRPRVEIALPNEVPSRMDVIDDANSTVVLENDRPSRPLACIEKLLPRLPSRAPETVDPLVRTAMDSLEPRADLDPIESELPNDSRPSTEKRPPSSTLPATVTALPSMPRPHALTAPPQFTSPETLAFDMNSAISVAAEYTNELL